MLACFHPGGEGEERVCGFAELARYLVALSEVLSAAQFPPTAEALRALFVFCYQESLLDPAFRLDEHLEGDLYSAEGALNGIREFNESVPLDLIVTELRYRKAEILAAMRRPNLLAFSPGVL